MGAATFGNGDREVMVLWFNRSPGCCESVGAGLATPDYIRCCGGSQCSVIIISDECSVSYLQIFN